MEALVVPAATDWLRILGLVSHLEVPRCSIDPLLQAASADSHQNKQPNDPDGLSDEN